MRSRALMGKWWLHLGQTLRFVSNSLSKIIVLHLGHLVQRPSGISRFLDLGLDEPSFGLRGSAGGFRGTVRAGSMIGTPTVFLANKLCSILELLRTVKNLSQTPRNCPD